MHKFTSAPFAYTWIYRLYIYIFFKYRFGQRVTQSLTSSWRTQSKSYKGSLLTYSPKVSLTNSSRTPLSPTSSWLLATILSWIPSCSSLQSLNRKSTVCDRTEAEEVDESPAVFQFWHFLIKSFWQFFDKTTFKQCLIMCQFSSMHGNLYCIKFFHVFFFYRALSLKSTKLFWNCMFPDHLK